MNGLLIENSTGDLYTYLTHDYGDSTRMADQDDDEFAPPVLLKEFPPFVTNEKAAFGPIHLFDYIDMTMVEYGPVKFFAEVDGGASLPKGLICTITGVLGGIPAEGTAATYNLHIIVENDRGMLLENTPLTINPSLTMEEPTQFANFKSEVWAALGKDLPLPGLQDVVNRPVTPLEIYYLLQRFAVLTIWDVYNLEAPGKKVLLDLPGANKYYNIYNRGSCLIAAPKDLYSHARTLEDALQASRLLAKEAYKRGWTIEFAGFNKMIRSAWIELQLQADKNNGKRIEILHYRPTTDDIKIYQKEAQASGNRPTF